MKKILIIDTDTPAVRYLLAAMKGRAHALNVMQVLFKLRPSLRQLSASSARPTEAYEKFLYVPGWTRFPNLSAAILRRAIKRAIRRLGGVEAVVYTLPTFADVASKFTGNNCQVYYAFDPYRFFNWDADRTMRQEKQMLEACDGAMAVSQALVEDLGKICNKPLFHFPNAVPLAFVQKLGEPVGDTPPDLIALRRPIVGCVGQMSKSYDWPLVGALADGLPEMTFVFMGQMFPEPADVRRPMDAVLARPNVKWLGTKPHAELPRYLRSFDVCLNPLAMTEHNDRRSPLRLYEYLATDRPILSTAIREAFTHASLIECFRTADEGTAQLRRMTGGTYQVDMAGRSAYIRANTWEARAEQFLSHIRDICASRPGGV